MAPGREDCHRDGAKLVWGWHTLRVAASTIISIVSLGVVAVLGWWNICLGKRTTKASEDSVKASRRAVALAEQDAKLRRVAGVLDVVLEMREMFNEQEVAHKQYGRPPSTPVSGSPETVARTALNRKLQGRLVLFEHELDSTKKVRTLTTSFNWESAHLEQAIIEVTDLLKATALCRVSPGTGAIGTVGVVPSTSERLCAGG